MSGRTRRQPWKVSNYDESNAGVLDLMQATGQSSNTAYAQLMLALGTDPVDTDGDGTARAAEGANNVANLATSMGVGGNRGHPRGPAGAFDGARLGLHAGADGRRVLHLRQPGLVQAAVDHHPHREGRPGWQQHAAVGLPAPGHPDPHRDPGRPRHPCAHLPGLPGGTAASANLGKDTAGKTGTSQENRNAWFAGFVPGSPRWCGWVTRRRASSGGTTPTPRAFDGLIWPMNRKGRLVQGRAATGGSFPATIWKKYMQVATDGMEDTFMVPTEQQINLGTVLHKNDLFHGFDHHDARGPGSGNGNPPPTTNDGGRRRTG